MELCTIRMRGGSGPAALLLHGGPGIPDYTEPLAAELAPLVTTTRYTQRGIEPSDPGPPYSVEVHAADTLAVLDEHGIDRAWVIGHSWGGQLALHLALSHPERLLGIVCIDPLGAQSDTLKEYRRNFRARMTAEDWARVEELDARSENTDVSVPERERAALEVPPPALAALLRRSERRGARLSQPHWRRMRRADVRVDQGALRAAHTR